MMTMMTRWWQWWRNDDKMVLYSPACAPTQWFVMNMCTVFPRMCAHPVIFPENMYCILPHVRPPRDLVWKFVLYSPACATTTWFVLNMCTVFPCMHAHAVICAENMNNATIWANGRETLKSIVDQQCRKLSTLNRYRPFSPNSPTFEITSLSQLFFEKLVTSYQEQRKLMNKWMRNTKIDFHCDLWFRKFGTHHARAWICNNQHISNFTLLYLLCSLKVKYGFHFDFKLLNGMRGSMKIVLNQLLLKLLRWGTLKWRLFLECKFGGIGNKFRGIF